MLYYCSGKSKDKDYLLSGGASSIISSYMLLWYEIEDDAATTIVTPLLPLSLPLPLPRGGASKGPATTAISPCMCGTSRLFSLLEFLQIYPPPGRGNIRSCCCDISCPSYGRTADGDGRGERERGAAAPAEAAELHGEASGRVAGVVVVVRVVWWVARGRNNNNVVTDPERVYAVSVTVGIPCFENDGHTYARSEDPCLTYD